jgi:hypothetical protein
MADEINELQKEWRAIVLEKLSTLEDGQSKIRSDIVDIKTSFVKQQALEDLRVTYRNELEHLRDKIDSLNAFKYKLIGITIAINAILSVVVEYVIFHGK